MTLLYRAVLRMYTLIEFFALGGSICGGSAIAWYAMTGPLPVAIAGMVCGSVLGLLLASYTAMKLDRGYLRIEAILEAGKNAG